MTTNTAEFVFSIEHGGNGKVLFIPADKWLNDEYTKTVLDNVPKVREIIAWFHQRSIDCFIDLKHRDNLTANGELVVTQVDIIANIPSHYLAGLEPKYATKPFDFSETVYTEMEKFCEYFRQHHHYFAYSLFQRPYVKKPLCELSHDGFMYGHYPHEPAAAIGAFFDYTYEQEDGTVLTETELVFFWGRDPEENRDVVWDKRDIYREVAERLKVLSLEKKNVKHSSTYMAFGRSHRYMFAPLTLFSDDGLPD